MKLKLIGNFGVGKTSINEKYFNNKIKSKHDLLNESNLSDILINHNDNIIYILDLSKPLMDYLYDLKLLIKFLLANSHKLNLKLFIIFNKSDLLNHSIKYVTYCNKLNELKRLLSENKLFELFYFEFHLTSIWDHSLYGVR